MHTGAVASIRRQGEAGLADTLKAAVLVDAHAVQAHVGGGALVVIWRGGGRGGEIQVKFTTVPVHLGPAVRLTDAVLPVGRELEAGVADALEAALRVDAAAVATHHPVDDALVDVWGEQGEEGGGKRGVRATRQSGRCERQAPGQREDAPMQACLVGVPW